MNSKLFIITLFAALTAFVAASTSTSDNALVLKRAALQARMHQRAVAGHGALKKRQPVVDAGKERIKRAQYHPTRTAAAAPGMEKRQFFGGNVNNNCYGIDGIFVAGPGCTQNAAGAQPSQAVCQAGAYDGCNPGASIGGGSFFGGLGQSGGISQCCQSGYSCTQVGPFRSSVCLNFVQAYNVNTAIIGKNFQTQQQLADFLAGLKARGL